MKMMASELVRWLEAAGLRPGDFRIRIEAKTIAAQRDLLKQFASDVEPQMSRPAASHLKPSLEGIEIVIDGPLPHFR